MRLGRSLMMAALLLAALVAPTVTSADVIFSNLGPGGTYNTGTAWTIGQNITMGPAFTVSGSYTLTNIELALLHSPTGNNGPVTLSLYTDAGGTPGTAFETWILGTVPDYPSPNGTLQTLSSAGFVLSDGTYWLIGSAPPEGWDLWMVNLGGTEGSVYRNGQVYQATMPAFQVNGTPIPEPGTLILLASGVIGLARTVRRKLLV